MMIKINSVFTITSFLTFVAFFTPLHGQSENDVEQEKVKITAVFHNESIIKDNKITYDYHTKLLQTYDENGNLIREIYNSPDQPGIEKYKFYFYKNNRLIRTDTYNAADSLIEQKHISYNSKGFAEQIKIIQPGEKHTTIIETHTLSEAGRPTKIVGRSENGKKLYSAKISYDENGFRTKERWKSKIQFPGDKIKKYNAEVLLDEKERKKQVTEEIELFNGEKTEQRLEFNYEKGNTTWISYYNQGDELLRKERKIFTDGELHRFTIYNNKNKFVHHTNYEKKEKRIFLGNVDHYLDEGD